ncbi:MAG: tropomyosin [Gammaproteobacteria bacterium]|nr:tropomyosin [Gammaproteobacteria bacterium]
MRYLLISVCMFFSAVAAADTVTDVKKLDNTGLYTMKINGKTFYAMPEATYNSTLKQLAVLEKARETIEKLSEHVKKQQALGDEYAALQKKYRELTDKYAQQTAEQEKLNKSYGETSGKLVTLNSDYSDTIKKFDKLVEQYREIAMRATPRQTWDIGFGTIKTNTDDEIVGILGYGFNLGYHFRVWAFGNGDVNGAAVGISF